MENSVYYERLAQLALEKNVNCLLRRMAREDDIIEPKLTITKLKRKKFKCKYTGVYAVPRSVTNPWCAYVGKRYLGVFATDELAHQARLKYIEEQRMKEAA